MPSTEHKEQKHNTLLLDPFQLGGLPGSRNPRAWLIVLAQNVPASTGSTQLRDVCCWMDMTHHQTLPTVGYLQWDAAPEGQHNKELLA